MVTFRFCAVQLLSTSISALLIHVFLDLAFLLEVNLITVDSFSRKISWTRDRSEAARESVGGCGGCQDAIS